MMMMMMMMMHHCHDHHRHHDPALVHCITKMFTKESFFSTILIPPSVTLEAMALFSTEGSKSVKKLYGKVPNASDGVGLWLGLGG